MTDKQRLARIVSGDVTFAENFSERVWAICARVPAGQVTTYGDIARALGTAGYRAVGMALNRNPHAPDVPCHRVVGRDGKLTGFASGIENKRAMLESEGVPMRGQRVDLAQCRAQL